MTTYKESHPDLEKRKQDSQQIRDKYPDRVPVICEKNAKSKLPEIDKSKFLVPNDLNAYHFTAIVRKRITLPETTTMYFFVNGKYLLKGDSLISDIYKQRADPDGFLYIIY